MVDSKTRSVGALLVCATSPLLRLARLPPAAVLALSAVLPFVGCRSNPSEVVVARHFVVLTSCNLGVPCTFSMATPAALTPAGLVLSATSSLQIDDRVTVKETNNTPATIANLGTGTTQIGTDGKLGDIWSNGPVVISDRTTVGTIHGPVKVTVGNGVTVKAKDTNAFKTLTTTGSVTFPVKNSGDVRLEPGVTSLVAPGTYGAVVVNGGGLLKLSTGSYLMDSLDLESSSAVALDTISGPVRLYVRSSAILRGNITSTTDARDFTLFYFGSADLNVEAPLNATVIAPIAKIAVKTVAPLSGAFFGQSIEVSPGDTIIHVAPRTAVVAPRNGRIEAETFDANSGGTNTGTAVEGLNGGNWLLFRGVNFGTAGQFNRIRFNLLSPNGVDEVVVHIDSLSGPTAADLITVPTGNGYLIQSAALSPGISGVHDTYVVVNGAEGLGIDWFELYKGPTRHVVVKQAPRQSPDAGAFDVSGIPREEQDDAPANVVWLDLPQNATIPAHASDGIAFTTQKPFTLISQVRWSGGSGPVSIQLLDQSFQPLTPLMSHAYPADNKFISEWAALPPQQLNVVVRNDGNTAVTVNVLVGFVPPQ